MRCLVPGSAALGDSHPGRHPLLHRGHQGGGHEGGQRPETAKSVRSLWPTIPGTSLSSTPCSNSISFFQLMLACWMTDPDERPSAEELNLMLADLARGGGSSWLWLVETRTYIEYWHLSLSQAWNLTFLWEQETSNTTLIYQTKSFQKCHKCQEALYFSQGLGEIAKHIPNATSKHSRLLCMYKWM